MANILIINGHQKTPFATGRLNRTLAQEMKKYLTEKGHKVKTTTVEKGYDVVQEQKKFMWADTIIFQYPVYWFGAPAILKQYIQDVYAYGIFYQTSQDGYGQGGLLKGKTYMLSTTWNAPKEAFGKFLPTIDEALVAMHQAQSFVGMKALPSFSCHDVIKNPQIEKYLVDLDNHLKKVFR